MGASTRSIRLLLHEIFKANLQNSSTSIDSLAEKLNLDEEYVSTLAQKALSDGSVDQKESRLHLTKTGRSKFTVVLAGGVFDIIHPGHIHTLTSSKKLGDILVVSVARDSTLKKTRDKPTMFNESKRAEMIGSLRFVDLAYLGSEKNIYETVEKVKPDIIAIGYDQAHSEKTIEAESLKRGVKVKVVRLDSPMPDIKSSKIKAESRIPIDHQA